MMQKDQQVKELDYERIIKPLEEWIRHQINDKTVPVIGIAISNREKNLFTALYHHDKIKTPVPSLEKSLFRVASVSKLFTCIALLQLVEKGVVKLSDPISKYMPQCTPSSPEGMEKDAYKTITVFHLMRHTSGMIREPIEGNYFNRSQCDLPALVESMSRSVLVNRPGTVQKYSNAAISLVAYIVEVASGEMFEDYVEKHVLKPIGMCNTTFKNIHTATRVIDESEVRTAVGHMWRYWDEDSTSVNVYQESPTTHFGMNGAGGLRATLPEICSFMRVFLNGGDPLIGEETMRQMLTPQPFDSPVPANKTYAANPTIYTRGLGAEVDQIYGLLYAKHGGAINGFASDFRVLPQLGIGIYTVCTLDCNNSLSTQLVEYALQLILLTCTPSPALPIDVAAVALAHNHSKGSLRAIAIPSDFDICGQYVMQPPGPNDNHRFKIVPSYNGKTYIRTNFYSSLGWIPAGLTAGKQIGQLITNDRLSYAQPLQLFHSPDGIDTAIGPFLRQKSDVDSLEYKPYNRLPSVVSQPPAEIPAFLRAVIGHYEAKDHMTLVFEEDGVLMMCIEWFFIYSMRLVQNTKDFIEFKLTTDCLYNDETVIIRIDSNGKPIRFELAGIPFIYKHVGPVPGEQQDGISPPEVIEELLKQSYNVPCPHPAPAEHGLVDLSSISPTLRLDVKYATTDNFAGVKLYNLAKSFLHKSAAQSLARAHQWLAQWGVGLIIFDAYRPWHVTWTMAEGVRPEFRGLYVADPAKGSVHNRGGAVDLTLYDLTTGEIIPMQGEFDEMSIRSHRSYFGGTSRQRWFKKLLTIAMCNHDFIPYPQEWWHFDFNFQNMQPVLNIALEDL
eukprot:gene1158-1326_t